MTSVEDFFFFRNLNYSSKPDNRLNGLAYKWEIGNPFSQETGKYSTNPPFSKIFFKIVFVLTLSILFANKYICVTEESITILKVFYIVYCIFVLATLAYHFFFFRNLNYSSKPGNRLNGLAYGWEIGNPLSQETGKYSTTPPFSKIFFLNSFCTHTFYLVCKQIYICEEIITILKVLYIVYCIFFLATLAYHQVQTVWTRLTTSKQEV